MDNVEMHCQNTMHSSAIIFTTIKKIIKHAKYNEFCENKNNFIAIKITIQ